MNKVITAKWFVRLEPRQQVLAVGVGASAVTLVAVVILTALHGQHARAARDVEAAQAVLTELRGLNDKLQSLQRNGGDAAVADIASLVTRSLQSFGLQPSRLQQNSPDELQLRLDGVAFPDAVAWLAAMEELPGIAVVRASFNQAANGTASLSLSLRRL
jgi:type II secretory pathway component PulM